MLMIIYSNYQIRSVDLPLSLACFFSTQLQGMLAFKCSHCGAKNLWTLIKSSASQVPLYKFTPEWGKAI